MLQFHVLDSIITASSTAQDKTVNQRQQEGRTCSHHTKEYVKLKQMVVSKKKLEQMLKCPVTISWIISQAKQASILDRTNTR